MATNLELMKGDSSVSFSRLFVQLVRSGYEESSESLHSNANTLVTVGDGFDRVCKDLGVIFEESVTHHKQSMEKKLHKRAIRYADQNQSYSH